MNRFSIHYILPILTVLPGILFTQESGQLLSTAKSLRMSDPDSSSWYATRAYQEALDRNEDSIALSAQFLIGLNDQMKGDKEQAIAVFKNVIEDTPEGTFPEVYIQAHGRIGSLYTELGTFDSSLVYLYKFDELVDTHWGEHKTDAKLLLGELYRAMGDLEQSDVYKLQAIERAEESGNRMEEIMALYYYLMDHRSEMHSASFQRYLEKYLGLVAHNGSGHADMGHITMFFEDLDEQQKILSLKKAIAGGGVSHLTSQLVYREALVNTYLEQQAFKAALPYAESGLALSKEANDKLFETDFLMMLFTCHEGLGQFGQAIRYLRAHYALADSLKDVRVAKNIDELSLKYQTAQKEKQLAEQQYALGQVRMERNFLVGGLAMLFWFGGFLVLYFWNRNRVNRKLALQESRINQQKIRELEQEKNLLAMSSMIEGQEAERKRIAQDLHDGLGGLLSNVKAQLHAIEMRVEALSNMDVYGKASQMVDQASKEVRRIAYNMMPTSLSRLGLEAAIEDLAADIANHHELHVETQLLDLDERLDETQEIMIYRIVQELCHNVVKHAQASEMIIQTNRLDDKLILVVEDNGKGFDPVSAKSSGGVGITSLESRVRYLGGDLDISSGEGGTCVTVSVPLL